MIVFSDNKEFQHGEIIGAQRYIRGEIRESLEIPIINSTYDEIKSSFVDGMKFKVIDKNYQEFDKSNYCVSGDIVDKRDGTLIVYAGVKTEVELLREQLNALMR